MLSGLKLTYTVVTILLLLGCGNQKDTQYLPVEVFFKNPEKNDFKISPSGKYISYLQPYENRLNVFVQSLEMGDVTQITKETDDEVSRYFWLNDDELLYMKELSSGGGEQVFIASRDGSYTIDLLQGPKGKVQVISPQGPINNELLIAVLNEKNLAVFDVYRLNVVTKELSLDFANPGNIIRWFSDENGELRLALASDGVRETLMYRENENASFRPVVTNNFKTTITPIGFCKHNKACIYALSNIGRDKKALVEFDCLTKKETRVIYSHPEVDVSVASYSPRNRELLSYSVETWKVNNYYINGFLEAINNELLKRLPGTEIQIVDRDSSERKFIVKSFTDKTPGAFYLYIPEIKKLTKLSDINSGLKANEMCSMKPISYKTRDGLTINGYLTIPRNKSPFNLPLVVMPHGGPSGRDSWEYNAEVQFLANRGYAVFQPNFRGSTGYGKEFWILGFKQWGGNVQNDITDGVKWLIEKRIANKNKIAIYGSDFGGFSALYGLCFYPDLYACGASYSGLVNLFTFIKDVPSYYKPVMQMYYERIGDPETDADYFRSVSPVFNLDKIEDPVLIAQGAKDTRANISEVNEFVKKLKNKNVPITYMLKENEGYKFKKQENRIEFYSQLEKFLSKNL